MSIWVKYPFFFLNILEADRFLKKMTYFQLFLTLWSGQASNHTFENLIWFSITKENQYSCISNNTLSLLKCN